MRTIRSASPLVLALSLLLLASAPLPAGQEDVSDGKTPEPAKKAAETGETKADPEKKASPFGGAPKVPVARRADGSVKKPEALLCKPSESAAVNTLEDLYGANGGELTELLKKTLVQHRVTHGAPGTDTAQASEKIRWEVTRPAEPAEAETRKAQPKN